MPASYEFVKDAESRLSGIQNKQFDILLAAISELKEETRNDIRELKEDFKELRKSIEENKSDLVYVKFGGLTFFLVVIVLMPKSLEIATCIMSLLKFSA